MYKEAEHILDTFLCILLCIPGIDKERAIVAANIIGPNTCKDSSQFWRSVLFILLTKGKEFGRSVLFILLTKGKELL